MMQLTQKSINKNLVIGLTGRFDAHEVPKVEQAIDEFVDDTIHGLIINLQGVPFIDSRALSVLVLSLKRCKDRNVPLILCHLQKPVRVIFELTRLDKAFQILPTEEDALKALSMEPQP